VSALAERPADLSVLPGGLLTPFDEVRAISWDEASGTGRVETARRNRLDDWYYPCHFLSDPVMPGCWGLDGVWQALRLFADWRGLPATKPLGMEGVSFFGQIRPYDGEVVYAVEVLTVERDGPEVLVTAKATVSVDGVPVYTIDSAQVGSAYWESDGAAEPPVPEVPARTLPAPLTMAEFQARESLSRAEVIALSSGRLVADPPAEMPLLPDSLMREVSEVARLSRDPASGEGEVLAVRDNGPREWFYSMNEGVKPAALLVDAVWQLIGVFHAWSGSAGAGRALGFERVEFHGEVLPADPRMTVRVKVLKTFRAPSTGDAFVRADAEVFAGGRKVMTCVNASVGCHRGIRYSDYPFASPASRGGRLSGRDDA
jgi:3-hydroxyacyl-[acyl-carrier protein] dehydratase/trans-2-decenoyl-[acyl-carrier protein] isomerase